MGNGMNKIITGLYVGNYRDAKDVEQLNQNNVTHILAIHDNAKQLLEDRTYLCIIASDCASQDLTQYFSECNDFIHKARLNGDAVIVHCLAGVSRSVTVTAAYIMTVTSLSWREALNAIRGPRRCANPNYGFQAQLQKFENEGLEKERARFLSKYPNNPLAESDFKQCRDNYIAYQKFIIHGDPPVSDDGLYPLPHNAYSERSNTRQTDGEGSGVIPSSQPQASVTEPEMSVTNSQTSVTDDVNRNVENSEK